MNEFYIDKLIKKNLNAFPELFLIDVKQKNYFFEKLNERFDYKKENISLSSEQLLLFFVILLVGLPSENGWSSTLSLFITA